MLQVHTYAQLAHWAFVTLTTVVDHCEKDRLLDVFSAWLVKSLLFKKRKNLLYLKRNDMTLNISVKICEPPKTT